jgi:hypothetical protein
MTCRVDEKKATKIGVCAANLWFELVQFGRKYTKPVELIALSDKSTA